MGADIHRPVVRRQARSGWVAINFAELWQYRDLLFFYAIRDVKVRYKQTLLGAAWAILQPVLTMVVFSIFFGRLAEVPSDGLPYPVFVFCALLPWQLFAFALTQSSNSLVQDAQVLTKVYFPRLIIPLASVLAGLVDFAIAFVVLIGMMSPEQPQSMSFQISFLSRYEKSSSTIRNPITQKPSCCRCICIGSPA